MTCVMRSVPIAAVELDDNGRVLVKPPPGSDDGYFRFIFRSATGVRWRSQDGSFHAVEARSLTSAAWFENIVSSVRGELGIDLRLNDETRWVSVPDSVRREIESLVSREPV